MSPVCTMQKVSRKSLHTIRRVRSAFMGVVVGLSQAREQDDGKWRTEGTICSRSLKIQSEMGPGGVERSPEFVPRDLGCGPYSVLCFLCDLGQFT